MSNVILLLSFTLNGIAILAIINLYLRQNRLVHTEKKLENSLKEIENLIASYLIEMKDENAAFIQRFRQLHKNIEVDNRSNKVIQEQTQSQKADSISDSVNQKYQETVTKSRPISPLEHTSRLQAKNTYQQSSGNMVTLEQREKQSETKVPFVARIPTAEKDPGKNDLLDGEKIAVSLHEKVIFLQQKGLTIEQIARRLNKGKTEVELLIKLNR